MTWYSVQPRETMFAKGYGFFSFPKNMGKNVVNVSENVSKNLSGKYSQKRLDYAKNLQQMHLKLVEKEYFQRQQKQVAI